MTKSWPAGMGKKLTAAQIAEFSERGILFPLRVVDPGHAATLFAELESLERAEGGRLSQRTNRKPHLLLTSLAALVRDARILDAVEDLIGPNILCWASDFFIKNAGDGMTVTWHQDSTYWGLSSADVVTVWVAFTDSTPETGCLRVVPGTHHEGQLPHRETYAANVLLSRGQEIAVTVDERDAVDVVLRPGEASIHHIRLVHGSEANRGNARRIGYAIRYIPTHVRQLGGSGDTATLVRGRDDHGNFVLETAPESDFHPDAVTMHAKVIEAQTRILMQGARQRPEWLQQAQGREPD